MRFPAMRSSPGRTATSGWRRTARCGSSRGPSRPGLTEPGQRRDRDAALVLVLVLVLVLCWCRCRWQLAEPLTRVQVERVLLAGVHVDRHRVADARRDAAVEAHDVV